MSINLFAVIISVITFLTFNSTVLAHGGVEKTSGPVTVNVHQNPLSPLVDEKVKITFIFNDTELKKRIPDLPVKLKVIDTFTGGASKDKIIFESDEKSDKNGALNFEYTFEKENYFDVELEFADHHSKKQTIGLLIQPRSPKQEPKNNKSFSTPVFILRIVNFISSFFK